MRFFCLYKVIKPFSCIEAHMYKKIYDWFRSWCVLCNSKENAKQLLPKYPVSDIVLQLWISSIVLCFSIVL